MAGTSTIKTTLIVLFVIGAAMAVVFVGCLGLCSSVIVAPSVMDAMDKAADLEAHADPTPVDPAP